jgi:hypothetical protein
MNKPETKGFVLMDLDTLKYLAEPPPPEVTVRECAGDAWKFESYGDAVTASKAWRKPPRYQVVAIDADGQPIL